jgi:hypothetical protein
VNAENRFWLREEKNAAVTTVVPVVTSNMGTIDSDPYPEPFDFCKSLNDVLNRWIDKNRLSREHCWSVAVRFYSDLGEAADLGQPPLLVLQDVRIPVADSVRLDEPERR